MQMMNKACQKRRTSERRNGPRKELKFFGEEKKKKTAAKVKNATFLVRWSTNRVERLKVSSFRAKSDLKSPDAPKVKKEMKTVDPGKKS